MTQSLAHPRRIARRYVLRFGAAATLATPLAACGAAAHWHNVDITHSMPALAFDMDRASDGKLVTAADYRGQVVALYFGYTNCPDACPTTLSNLSAVLDRMGKDAAHMQVLFVTVDPNRDSLQRLKQYTAAFSPRMDGLRGTPDALARLARRYRAAYSVTPASPGHPYTVTHATAIYVFDATGDARLLVASMASTKPDIGGTASDLTRLVNERPGGGVVGRLLRMV